MARTEQEVYNEAVSYKDADPILSTTLTSNSKASFHLTIAAMYAFLVSVFEQAFDAFKSAVETLLEQKQVMTAFWFRESALDFQLGDPLTFDDSGNVVYATEDASKQIIKRVAVTTPSAGSVTLKVAKLNAQELPVPLSTSENTAFSSYFSSVGPAGINIVIVSLNGDEVRIGLDVEVDKQVIDADTGGTLLDGTVYPAENGVNDYFATFQNNSFGGVFYASKLLQSVLSQTGIVNAVITALEKKADGEGSFVDVLALPTKSFATLSGYVRIADGWDLSANINYS